MKCPFPSKFAYTLLACLAAFCLLGTLDGAQAPKLTPAQINAQKKVAQAQAQARRMAMDALRRQEAEGLRTAYTLLALANNNYAGHKGKAMREVEAALVLLDANAMKPLHQRIRAMQRVNSLVAAKLFAAALAPDANELQAISDAQVANAGAMLTYLAFVMAANQQYNLRDHVQNAVNEIQAGPKRDAVTAMIKGRQAQVLTSAYILLASANHDYGGHRVKAMNAVARATNQLDAQILKHGSVQQRISALQGANAELAARISANQEPAISEPQVMSDAQLLLADALIQRVAFYLQSPQQKTALSQIRAAHAEIGSALSVR